MTIKEKNDNNEGEKQWQSSKRITKMKERKNDDDGEEHFRKRTGMKKKNNDNKE